MLSRDQSVQVQQKDKGAQVKESVSQQRRVEEEEGGSVWSLLHRLKGADLVRGRKVFAVKPSFSVPDAARILADNHISSAPVIGDNGQVLGLLDFLDFCYFVSTNMPADEEIGTRARHDAERSLSAERMRSKTVADVMNFGGQNPMRTFNENESLSNIVSYFVEDANASHRVVLLSADGRCAGYLTQSDVVKYLYQNLSTPYLADLKDKTLRQLHWMPRPLDLVTTEDSVRDALRTLLRANGNTLPIVDKNSGKLENNFSPSDIKGIFREETPRFTQTIKSFLISSSPRAAYNEPQFITWDASIQDICKKLILGKIHHLWLVDPVSCTPTGIVTMSDVLRMVCQSR